MPIYKGPKLLKNKAVIKKRKARFEGDWLTCGCHNDAMMFGFWIATKNGGATKKQYMGRFSGWYGCNHCGAIIKAPKRFPFSTMKIVMVSIAKFATEAQLQYADERQNS